MTQSKKIPLHIISGFLGVGKTTTIIQLLKQAPSNEYIATVINEYGDIGIDGTILASETQSLAIKEIPGGCICCSSGELLVETLETLIQELKPTRLIIEPSGIARPSDIQVIIENSPLKNTFDIHPMITLIDPELYQDENMKDDFIYEDQLESSDIIGITKTDLNSDEIIQRIINYFSASIPPKLGIFPIKFGKLPFSVLNLNWNSTYEFSRNETTDDHHHHLETTPYKGFGYILGDGIFSLHKLTDVFHSILSENKMMRMKGIFRTDEGLFLLELTLKRFHQKKYDYRNENRVDMILKPGQHSVADTYLHLIRSCRIIT